MLSIKMSGLIDAGDGVIMVSTGYYDRGAVAIIQNAYREKILTFRFSQSGWDSYKVMTNA